MKFVFRAWFMLALCCMPATPWAQTGTQAVSGTVSGKVQQVGFRALILKQAIRYNLAGTAQNLDNGTVAFKLQGSPDRIEQALQALRSGTSKSSDVRIDTSPAPIDANVDTFRVVDWTSTSRNITTPHDLLFSLRTDGSEVSRRDAQKIYQDILKNALK